ncbi:hypothetical protein C3L55_08110 [Veillonellaceae bacterium M1-70]|nr:hypothetical protein [Veillonellaceae bacterium M1-70]
MKTSIIPIFIPHIGCPYRCVFCNQWAMLFSVIANALSPVPIVKPLSLIVVTVVTSPFGVVTVLVNSALSSFFRFFANLISSLPFLPSSFLATTPIFSSVSLSSAFSFSPTVTPPTISTVSFSLE